MNRIFKGKAQGYEELCVPLDITQLYEPAFRYRSRRSNSGISLRPVCLPLDEEMVRACALPAWIKNHPASTEYIVGAEKKLLTLIADSSSGQTFLGMIDDQPAFLLAVHHALQHPISLDFKARKEDYLLTLRLPPYPWMESMDDLSLSVLQACLVHCFSYSRVDKLFARIDRDDRDENELYERAGFRFLGNMDPDLRLYYHTGTGFLDR